MDILEFQGEYRWLSNFWPAKVSLDGVTYPSVEHAYQASKAHPEDRTQFLSCTTVQAKKIGRTVAVRSGWEENKLIIMRDLISHKFSPGSDLAERLLSTGSGLICEGNYWGDTFWGVCRGKGENHLGKIIMARRSELLQLVLDSAKASQSQDGTLGTIRVVSKRQGGTRARFDEVVIDGDRKNPILGNRHYLKDWRDPDERDRVIEKHRIQDFEPDILKGGAIYREMVSLAEQVRQGKKIALACWCAPLRCHCDHIVEGVRKIINGVDLQAEMKDKIRAPGMR